MIEETRHCFQYPIDKQALCKCLSANMVGSLLFGVSKPYLFSNSKPTL